MHQGLINATRGVCNYWCSSGNAVLSLMRHERVSVDVGSERTCRATVSEASPVVHDAYYINACPSRSPSSTPPRLFPIRVVHAQSLTSRLVHTQIGFKLTVSVALLYFRGRLNSIYQYVLFRTLRSTYEFNLISILQSLASQGPSQ
jgi:hypothetical protein